MTESKADGKKRGRKVKIAPGSAKQEEPTKADIESLAAPLALTHEHCPSKRVAPGTKLQLSFSEEERRLILDNGSVSSGLTDEQLKALAAAEKPELLLTLDDWEDFAGWVAATGNHARSGSRLRSRADALLDRIEALLESCGEE